MGADFEEADAPGLALKLMLLSQFIIEVVDAIFKSNGGIVNPGPPPCARSEAAGRPVRKSRVA